MIRARMDRMIPAKAAATMLAVLCLGGCVETGDFGRPKTSVWNDTVIAGAGRLSAMSRSEATSSALLTDDEQDLRGRAAQFFMPAQERNAFDNYLAYAAAKRVLPPDAMSFDGQSYWSGLASSVDRSPRARYQRLREDIEADRLLLGPFSAVACRVADTDRLRLAALNRISEPGPEVRKDVVARVDENVLIVGWVRTSVDQREAAYRYALERLVVESPDRDAVKTERTLTAFSMDRGILDRCRGGGVPLSGTAPTLPFHPKSDLPPRKK